MTAPDPAWTIDRLSQLVAEVLSADYPGQSNGRIRQVPDVRTIRWYTSIGLLDRPAALRGRTALYGRRHLAQLVAVKRLQADGLSLAAVQQQLIGADDAALERIARLGDLPDRREPERSASPADSTSETESEVEPSPDRDRFWSARPRVSAAAAAPTAARPEPARSEPAGALLHGIRLAPDVSLLLEAAGATPDDEALAVLVHAAQPLLDALRALGLSQEHQDTDAVRRGTWR